MQGHTERRMSQESEIGPECTFTKAALVAVAFALAVTFVGWFIAGRGSPVNHGANPDVHGHPLLMLWVVANLPAAILYVNVFGKLGSEAAYFFCVFVEWLLVGTPVSFVLALLRRRGTRARGRTEPRSGARANP